MLLYAIAYNCVHNCEDQPSFDFISAVHMINFIYITFKNGFVGMCHLGVNQLITVYHFSLLCEMDESSSRFRIPKTSDEEKTSIINSVPKSMVNKNKWAI